MSSASLSTEQAPHISVPLRFFAIAPLFLLLAALILAITDSNPFENARTPAMLAITHCITLGFIGMIMLGATQQILPVVIGSPMPASRQVQGPAAIIDSERLRIGVSEAADFAKADAITSEGL